MSKLTSYHIEKTLLPSELADVVVEFSSDAELDTFLEDCRLHPHTFKDFFLFNLLSPWMSDYEAHALLGMYPMHLLSEEQWEALIPESTRQGRLLDIGAGQGFVTERARNLFSEIHVTETSPTMSKRLRAKGFQTHTLDVANSPDAFAEKSFDVISILNVLDRCTHPRTLLANAVRFLKDDGVLILTDPLPFTQTVLDPFSKPQEILTKAKYDSWEKNLVDFYQKVIVPAGLVPIRISRLPYVCKFSKDYPYISLDDFLFVCKKA